eukprot:594803-Hanusia_phi.AAC.2
MQVSKPKKCETGCIIGAVIGSVVGALLLVGGTVYTYKQVVMAACPPSNVLFRKCQAGDPELGTGRQQASHGGAV